MLEYVGIITTNKTRQQEQEQQEEEEVLQYMNSVGHTQQDYNM